MNKNTIDLAGQTAVVTGGGAGLGFAIAVRLLESGANVSIWDADPKALELALPELDARGGSGTVAIQGLTVDISDAASVDAGVAETRKAFGGIDILVNNAGISGPNAPTWEYDVEAFKQVIAVDLTGTFIVSRAVVPVMLEKSYGRIVNVASVAGKDGNPNAPAYSAAKAGVICLTKTMGKELAQKGVIVNCITPAAVKTALFDQMTQEHVDYMLSKIPMGRFGEVEEIAAMVAWMSSRECSFSTGAAFDLSGGRATY